MKRALLMISTVIVASSFLTACGTEDPEEVETDLTKYYPLATGNYWVYEEIEVDDSGNPAEVRHEVVGLEQIVSDYIEMPDYELVVQESVWTKPGASTVTKTQYMEDDGERVVRYRQIKNTEDGDNLHEYDPGLLRFDRTQNWVGARWDQESDCYGGTCDPEGDESNHTELGYVFEVLAVSDEVQVPAGTFACLKFRRVDCVDNEVKDYWYAANVGKVKEETSEMEWSGGSTDTYFEDCANYAMGELVKTENLVEYHVAD